MKNFLFSIIFLTALSSCVSRLDKHGYMFDLSDSEMLQEGVTSKERVLRVMGSPTVVSDLDSDETWIYYSENVDNFLFFKPDVVERNVIVLSFNDSGTVKEIKKINLEQEDKNLNFVSNYTQVQSHQDAGFFKSILSNVGQVKPQ